MVLINEKTTIRICLKCGEMFQASKSDFLMSREVYCRSCDGLTGFFTSNDHLKRFCIGYSPDPDKRLADAKYVFDIAKVQDTDLRTAITELMQTK